MAKPNYSFAKRQRDLAKKAKKEEKRQRKAEAKAALAGEGADPEADPAIDGDAVSADDTTEADDSAD
jgi:hypothetical protein